MKYLVVGILIFAVGLTALFWAKNARNQADIQLKNKEKIAEAMTRQVMLERKIKEDYENRSRLQAREQELQRFLNGK